MKLFDRKSSAEANRSVLAILSSDDVRMTIEKALSSLPAINIQFKISEDTIANAGHLVNGSADIVILEIDLTKPMALMAIEKLNGYVGISGSLIIVAKNPDTHQIRNLFKMGVSDVLQSPLKSDDILSSIKSVLAHKKTNVARPAAGRVISIMKCGGGVGATMLATNMAYNMASRRKTKTSALPKTLVIDLDIQFGNVATTLNSVGKMSLLDLIKAEDRLDSSMVAASTRAITDDMDIIACADSIIPLSALTPEFLEKLISLTKPFYDYIILDHPTAWSGSTAKSSHLSDIIIPVMHARVEHVAIARRFLEGLENLSVSSSKTYFFINEVEKGLSSKDRVANIDSITKRPSFSFTYHPKVHQQARDQGVLLHQVSGSGPEQKQMAKFVDHILKHLNTVDKDQFLHGGSDQPAPSLSLG